MGSTFSVREICERYGVSDNAVILWMRNGELWAINVGRRQGAKKPRWRISQESITAFKQSRTPTPPPPRGRRKKRPVDVIEFYK